MPSDLYLLTFFIPITLGVVGLRHLVARAFTREARMSEADQDIRLRRRSLYTSIEIFRQPSTQPTYATIEEV